MSLSAYLGLELERVAAQLTPDELGERLDGLGAVTPKESPDAAVRAVSSAR